MSAPERRLCRLRVESAISTIGDGRLLTVLFLPFKRLLAGLGQTRYATRAPTAFALGRPSAFHERIKELSAAGARSPVANDARIAYVASMLTASSVGSIAASGGRRS